MKDPIWIYTIGCLLLLGGGIAVGVIKLMAWWQIAMNGCASV